MSNPVITKGSSISFDYERNPNEVMLYKNQYKLEVWGAKGGDSMQMNENTTNFANGGLGGYLRGILSLEENKKVFIYVGGKGKMSNPLIGDTNEGGFPDGGSTSMRIGTDSDYSRVIVAGAGGGACNRNGYINQGGFGGGLTGGNCYHEGVLIEKGAGTQTYSTGDFDNAGSFGHGANGESCIGYSSGGSGGWFGGGSGGYCDIISNSSSGGGGSVWTFNMSNFMKLAKI